MRRMLLLCLVSALLGGGLAYLLTLPREPRDVLDASLVATRVREVAKLEALEVRLYRKVSFEPDPQPQGSFWADVWSWARQSLRPPHGRAIVFARAHLGYDLSRLPADSLRVHGRDAQLQLPPLEVTVELLPGETEIIGSNLDSAETAQLLELARVAFERQVTSDPELRARAEASARHTLEALLFRQGAREVVVQAPLR